MWLAPLPKNALISVCSLIIRAIPASCRGLPVMLDHLEKLALFSVGRGVGYAAIIVVMVFLSLVSDPANALRSAGMMSLLISLVLLLRARGALNRPYKRTELWILLKPGERPQTAVAQQVIGTVLCGAYLYFARHTAVFAAVTLAVALGLALFDRFFGAGG
jgi:hypothetical protein